MRGHGKRDELTFLAMLKVERHDFGEQFRGSFLIRTGALLTRIADERWDGGMITGTKDNI